MLSVFHVRENRVNTEVEGHVQGLPYKVRLYRAHISCANEVLKIGGDPEFVHDLQFNSATNMCIGDLNAAIEDLHAEIEYEADSPGFGEWAQTLATLNIQRLDLIDESEQFMEDMERRWGQNSTMVGRLAWHTVSSSTPNRPLPPFKRSNLISWLGNTNPRMSASLNASSLT